MRAEQLTDVTTQHGEGPAWSPRWAGPRFVDMLAGDLCELQPTGNVNRRHVGPIAAMIRPRTRPGFIVAGEHNLLLAYDDALDAELTPLPDIVTDSRVRFNEGGCDPAGQLFVGTMAYNQQPGAGGLYRISTSLSVEVVKNGVTVSNGIGWSPDTSHCYYVDSATRRIDRYAWSSDGLTDRRLLVSIAGDGQPDGLAIDSDGNIWVALFGGGQVHCYTPVGDLVAVVEVPVAQVTAVCFSGENLDDLLITTSRNSLNDPEPAAGALFHCTPGTRGLPLQCFGG